jgi:hypothetical protein
MAAAAADAQPPQQPPPASNVAALAAALIPNPHGAGGQAGGGAMFAPVNRDFILGFQGVVRRAHEEVPPLYHLPENVQDPRPMDDATMRALLATATCYEGAPAGAIHAYIVSNRVARVHEARIDRTAYRQHNQQMISQDSLTIGLAAGDLCLGITARHQDAALDDEAQARLDLVCFRDGFTYVTQFCPRCGQTRQPNIAGAYEMALRVLNHPDEPVPEGIYCTRGEEGFHRMLQAQAGDVRVVRN